MIKFHHEPGFNGKGGATLAYEIITNKNGKKLKIAIGLCSYKDPYCRKKGRDSATKQLVAGNTIEIITKRKLKDIPKVIRYFATSSVYLFDHRIEL